MENKTAIAGIVRDRHFPPIFMDNGLRRLFFPPEKLVSKYVSEGEVIADLGCGPGYFTLPIAKIVGQNRSLTESRPHERCCLHGSREKDEWSRLVSENFTILKQGEGLTTRWAHVSPASEGEMRSVEMTKQQREDYHGTQPSCCSPS